MAAMPVRPISVPKTSPLAPKPKIPAGAAKAASPTASAQSTIQTIIAPIIKQISDAESARASQGQQLISGYTGDAAKQLAGIDYASPYATAATQSDAINNALMARLQGQGTAGQSQLQGALSAAGADPTLTAALKAQIGNIAAGAANAGLASGDATTNQLLSEGANAQGYGNKLPGITELAGAQDVSKLLGQVANDQHTQLQSVQAQVPGMVQSELASEQTAKSQAATLAADRKKAMAAVIMANGYDPSTGGITPGAQKALAKLYGLPASSFTGTSASTAAKIIGENAANQRAAAGRAASAGRTAAANAKPSASLSAKYGYIVDGNGNPVLGPDGKRIPVATSSKAKGPSATLLHEAAKRAEDLYYGVSHQTASGTTVVDSYSQTYADAIKTLAREYPTVPHAQILKWVNGLYAPGGTFPDGSPNGRPGRPAASVSWDFAQTPPLKRVVNPFGG